eukprot:gnl/TRDRNA2_/TRDRNA2_40546_c0_seq1.p1 gnl/TRDRNA2_/TRDRNA2_40546_c0~~gnl/TRDRNA2_/TRDRNA2_40546_c0_seq1.p1  ORF type:complete len:256 (+),score=48.00 gnl/TRDRNA2_/TRDRNA2_40546_c0_seq1:74-841(+)
MSVTFEPLDKISSLPGMRITMLPGMPGVFAEALKNFCYVKKIPVTRVLHPFGDAAGQKKLYELTAQTSLPTMFWQDERPRNSWIEQLMLAEKVGSGPSTIPQNGHDRVLMFGLLNELLGEDGLLWNKRLLLGSPETAPFLRKYGWSSEAVARAPRRIAEVLKLFDEQLAAQEKKGTKFIIGNALSALDVYAATCAIIVAPPGPELIPRTKENQGMLRVFAVNPPDIKVPQRIIDHQHFILKTYCECPAVLGGSKL